MNIKRFIIASVIFFSHHVVMAQLPDSVKNLYRQLDSLYIDEVETRTPAKVLHAEPLYVDLIRDLGARKGEREWNFGIGLTDHLDYDTYEALIEYEFAPINRLGFEVEIPVTIVAKKSNGNIDADSDLPATRIESFKTAVQWSFLVSERYSTSLALGYINELEFSNLKDFGSPLFTGNVYNPFFVAAKRLNNNWHTLLYTGPKIHQSFQNNAFSHSFEINSNVHYMITGTRNFIGIEFNKEVNRNDFDMVIRPQMRVEVTNNILIGIVGGIPVARETQRFSMFTRIIWEPMHRR